MALGSVTARNRALDACYGTAHATSWPGTLYIAFYDNDPTGTGVEASGGGYGRIAVANTDANWPAASAGQKSNGVEFVTPASTGAWDRTVTWFAIIDSASGAGNLHDYGQLASSVTIPAANYTARFQVGTLVIGVT